MVQFHELKGFINDSSMNFYEKPVLYPDLHLSSDSKPSRRHENISLFETFAVLSSITSSSYGKAHEPSTFSFLIILLSPDRDILVSWSIALLIYVPPLAFFLYSVQRSSHTTLPFPYLHIILLDGFPAPLLHTTGFSRTVWDATPHDCAPGGSISPRLC